MNIKYIALHCSYVNLDTDDKGYLSDAETTHKYHTEIKGWDGIGYHYFIKRDGTIQRGRPEYWQGAHVRGYNKESIAICLAGRGDYTDAQKAALSGLIEELLLKYPCANVVGHYQLDDNKTCPLFDVPHFLQTGEFKSNV